eukprot:1888495-Prymnesium_polylepis.1
MAAGVGTQARRAGPSVVELAFHNLLARGARCLPAPPRCGGHDRPGAGTVRTGRLHGAAGPSGLAP